MLSVEVTARRLAMWMTWQRHPSWQVGVGPWLFWTPSAALFFSLPHWKIIIIKREEKTKNAFGVIGRLASYKRVTDRRPALSRAEGMRALSCAAIGVAVGWERWTAEMCWAWRRSKGE
ncbi:hypothetical protein SUGI_0009860 [Cryptomeria japonica]|nr:hypothetical protein SUGI_0009860 [Cryptomeria japonica]